MSSVLPFSTPIRGNYVRKRYKIGTFFDLFRGNKADFWSIFSNEYQFSQQNIKFPIPQEVINYEKGRNRKVLFYSPISLEIN